MSPIAVGSLVTLKSGGPSMVVDEFLPTGIANVACIWTSTDGVIQKHSFSPHVLVVKDEEGDTPSSLRARPGFDRPDAEGYVPGGYQTPHPPIDNDYLTRGTGPFGPDEIESRPRGNPEPPLKGEPPHVPPRQPPEAPVDTI